MIFKDYLLIVWRRRWILIFTILATLAVVAVGTYLTPPTYAASAILRVATASSGSVSYTDYVYADRLVNTYVHISTSRPVLDELAVRLGRTEAPEVQVQIVTNTELLSISVEDSDPQLAATAANTLASILIEQSQSLYTGGGRDPKDILADQLTQIEAELTAARAAYDELVRNSPSDSEAIAAASSAIDLKQNTYATLLEQYEEARLSDALRANTISILESAIPPEKPIRPNVLINFGLGFILALLAGLGLVFVFSHFDTTLYTTSQIERLVGQSALAHIPVTHPQQVLLTGSDGRSPYGQSYRRLRSTFLNQLQTLACQTVMITSPEPEEGKSTIAVNLAVTLAQAGRRVILVDFDLARSQVAQILNLPNELGLANVLTGQTELNSALQSAACPGLRVLTSGTSASESGLYLNSSLVGDLVNQLAAQSDIVLFDSPAILLISDSTDLAAEVDGVLMVVRRGATHQPALEEARSLLDKLNTPIIGYIVNRAEANHATAYYTRPRQTMGRRRL